MWYKSIRPEAIISPYGNGTVVSVPLGIVDFDGDGKTDFLWHHATSGQTALWLIDGVTISSIGPPGVVSELNWQIAN
jgi:hypothetical protein